MISCLAEDLPSGRGHLTSAQADEVGRDFALGDIQEIEFLPSGLMNQNWRFRAISGSYAVKRITDVDVALARRNLLSVTVLAAHGCPVSAPAMTRDGDPVTEVGGSAYCAVPWVSGEQPRGLDLARDQARALGAVLAELHTGLAHVGDALLAAPVTRPPARVAEAGRAVTEADRFLGLARSSASRFDGEVAELLEQRKVLLAKYEHLRPSSDVASGPFGWTHGDFQHLNVIWADGVIAAVIDWDRIRVRVLGEEVARSATLLFGHEDGWLDLDRVAAFVAGYRSAVDIDGGDLVDAMDRLWWKRMCDYWHLEFHYDRGDHSCDHLFRSASRFLGWWTDRLDEVRDAVTARG